MWILGSIFLVIMMLFLFISSLTSDVPSAGGNVAVIQINGEIVSSGSGGFFDQGVVSSLDVIELLEKARRDDSIKAVLLEINSPGGSPVGSEEIVNEVKKVKKEKLVVSVIRESGASGAYWVASASNHIIASPLSITGSVGVLGSYLEFSGLMEKYGVSYVRLNSGKYKDLGSPLRELSPEEKAIMQKKIEIIHKIFLNDVAKNRNLTASQYSEISTGIFYLGDEAIQINLVDKLGDKNTALELISKQINETAEEVPYQTEKGFFESLSGIIADQSFLVGYGFGKAVISEKSEKIKI